jgi:hypothetical protein
MSAAQQVPPDLAGESAATTKLQELLLDSYAAMAPVFDSGQTRVAWLSAFALAALRRHAWRPASTPPATCAPIAVLGVVDDPSLRMTGDDAFVDVVHYWPEKNEWTVTHLVRASKDATDFPVKVVAWQPMLELPPPWSELWRGASS